MQIPFQLLEMLALALEKNEINWLSSRSTPGASFFTIVRQLMEGVPAVSSPDFIHCRPQTLLYHWPPSSSICSLLPHCTPQSLQALSRPLILAFHSSPWMVSPVPRTPVNILVRFLSLYHSSSCLYFFYMHVLNLSHLKWNSHAQLQIHVLSGVMPPSSVQLPHEETRQSGSTFSCSHGPHIQSMAQSSSTRYSLCHYPGHRLHHLIWMMIS